MNIKTKHLYCSVELANRQYAEAKKKEFGTMTNYVNFLIARDSGNKTSLKRATERATRFQKRQMT